MRRRQKWCLHVCALDRECRNDLTAFGVGAPWRLEINTPWWHLGIALSPGNRYVRLLDLAAGLDGPVKYEWTSFRRWTDG